MGFIWKEIAIDHIDMSIAVIESEMLFFSIMRKVYSNTGDVNTICGMSQN